MKNIVIFAALLIFGIYAAPDSFAQPKIGGILNKAKDKAKGKDADKAKETPKTTGKTQTGNTGDSADARRANAEKLAKAAGLPKAANTNAALNKQLFQAADDHRLVPRKLIVTDTDWLVTTGAHNEKARQIFGVLGRTTDDGKCAKQMVQFEQSWRGDKWGATYVQNIGAIVPIQCNAVK